MTNQAEKFLRAEFNEWARQGRGESMERGHRPVGEQAISEMGINGSSRTLDLGCGSGWATRLMAGISVNGTAVGVDVSDEMVQVAKESSRAFSNVIFSVSSAEALAFGGCCFTHAFTMESLYYYSDPGAAICEVQRVLAPGGVFCAVVDLFMENEPTHFWIDKLNVPVHLLGRSQYEELFALAGFDQIRCRLLKDPSPIQAEFSSNYFRSIEDYYRYREIGSLMIMGYATDDRRH